ncbi:UDP-N-acetylmuramoyl-L-alanyl-D-glutamate--2,6-diaminopimelate ligase [Wenyingzhuangia sp. 2_MG-2023]|uniref:UDP-N-acetylmuramoyl-L-alanyl-D-glutamate--2, 6-diaminopimelate ligase n=1 Tax=Wenyingzhuangia sp. 2_MG-2023 TaxID=3062639 RepID=UPI0026E3E38D|nr:UDP-N-acetylmuramoyl-L-alanyl-D-glutamate--2,6-diaminopimelate ligase [Wenyingzhuangia sp. 2_MG-2023]MDO6737696.1 UDP-N-acetylmuramoyl-L-alanyl-D-glutamate--2,6-diaminopimelate ligase [Wenyingzhuangia sp. 2_MG-2023]
MELKEILEKVTVLEAINFKEKVEVSAIAFDSRKVTEDTLFIAQRGVHVDGHDYIAKAIALGANVIVCEILPKEILASVVYIVVENADKTLALVAANFYGHPSGKLKLVGVTGTNGKTTVASLLYQLFQLLGYKTGLLSTVKIKVGAKEYPATHTTPDSLTINKYLAEMVANGVTYCFMEVSSHGIHQSRTYALDFDGGVFTNLTHDHLDYHKTFSEYRDVKKVFFDELGKQAFALTNLDDKNGSFMLQNSKASKKSYAQKTLADYRVKIVEKSFLGMLLVVNNQEVWVQLVGGFNASNLAAIYGVASELGVEEEELLIALSQLKSVDGRFQYQVSSAGIVSVVDYAHTPDALKNILSTIRDIVQLETNIITVVGCGGDRDKTKRPKMAAIAMEFSDQVILTSDNPRTEDPMCILEDMEAGVAEEDVSRVLSILDRKQAIKTACKLAKKGDVVLVAGKGHETYQEINGERTHFDDKEILIETFQILKK